MPTPSLLIVPARFKSGKMYSQIPTSGAGDFTVTRATIATRVNASGLIESVASGIPRLDYYTSGGVTGCPALLVEPSGQNLYQQSEDFGNAYWTKSSCTVSANQTTAPDGTLTADKLIMNNGILPNSADQHGIYRVETVTSSAYRVSIFAKAGEFTGFRVRENLSNGNFLDVNLTNGAITNPDTAQFISPLAQNYGNGWYRISWTSPTITSLQKYSFRVGSTGDGTSGIFIWGAQLETGSVATSYIPTTTASVTRNADAISVSGAVSGSIGQTEGTIYAEVDLTSQSAVRTIITVSDNSTTNRIRIRRTGLTTIDIERNVSGSANVSLSATIPASGIVKIAVGYSTAASGYIAFVNGSQAAVNASAISMFTNELNKLNLGSNFDGSAQLNDRIRAAALYTTRLTNAQLAALTTP